MGFESTVDKVFSFPSVEKLKQISKGKIKPLMEKSIKFIKSDKDIEIPIDDFKWKNDLRKALAPYEKKVSLGGNGAIEASCFHALGIDAKFVGTYSEYTIQELNKKNPEQLKHFLPTISSLSLKIKNKPTSYIIQVDGIPSRVILCDGSGRRYDTIRKNFKKIQNSARKYASLVGWHVLFPHGIDDNRELLEFIENLSKKSKIFSDLGSFKSRRGIKKIFEVILRSNVISMNEVEFNLLTKVTGPPEKIMEKFDIDVFYVHGHKYQWSLTRNREMATTMEIAQRFSAAAATYRIETMSFPTMKDLKKILKRAKRGHVKKKGKFYITKTPTIQPKKILSTVGAGDVAFSALITSLIISGF